MRSRPSSIIALIVALAAVLSLPLAAASQPAPHQRAAPRPLTINAAPDPIDAGDPVIIFGRLRGPGNGGQTVVLMHRIHPAKRFTPVQRTRTDANGFYAIQRPDGVVTSNRDWFVQAGSARSRVVHEKVRALVSMTPSATSVTTGDAVTFTGKVLPAHPGEQIVLQRQVGDGGEDWHVIGDTRTAVRADGSFSISKAWPVANTYTVRVHYPGDARNLAGNSDSVDIAVQQAQHPEFTLEPSADPINAGDTVTLTGALAAPGNAKQAVTLYARQVRGGFEAVATTTTGDDGSFSFTRSPIHRVTYQVRTDSRMSAQVFVAVRDVVTASVDRTVAVTGQRITFSGTVTPDKTGHRIELQRQGADGDWHAVETAVVGAGSTYSMAHVLEAPGTKEFRVHINGGPANWGASSPAIAVTVGAPPVTG